MIRIERTEVQGWEAAIRGMRNPMNSWDKSDSKYKYWCSCLSPGEKPHYCENCGYDACNPYIGDEEFVIGPNDLKLMKNLSNAGNDHGKFLRMINVTCDIIAPLYWWKEFDTYKVGTVANSCSTMHKIHAKEFTLDDFSNEHLIKISDSKFKDEISFEDSYHISSRMVAANSLELIIKILNHYRKLYIETKDKKYWWQMIQLLPSSYNQRRTVQLNYQVLKTIYNARKDHKLDEWHSFCHWVEALPYFKEICLEKEEKKDKTRYFEFNYINNFGDTVTGYFKFSEPVTQEKIEDNFKKWIDPNCVKSWYKEIIFNEGE